MFHFLLSVGNYILTSLLDDCVYDQESCNLSIVEQVGIVILFGCSTFAHFIVWKIRSQWKPLKNTMIDIYQAFNCSCNIEWKLKEDVHCKIVQPKYGSYHASWKWGALRTLNLVEDGWVNVAMLKVIGAKEMETLELRDT